MDNFFNKNFKNTNNIEKIYSRIDINNKIINKNYYSNLKSKNIIFSEEVIAHNVSDGYYYDWCISLGNISDNIKLSLDTKVLIKNYSYSYQLNTFFTVDNEINLTPFTKLYIIFNSSVNINIVPPPTLTLYVFKDIHVVSFKNISYPFTNIGGGSTSGG